MSRSDSSRRGRRRKLRRDRGEKGDIYIYTELLQRYELQRYELQTYKLQRYKLQRYTRTWSGSTSGFGLLGWYNDDVVWVQQ